MGFCFKNILFLQSSLAYASCGSKNIRLLNYFLRFWDAFLLVDDFRVVDFVGVSSSSLVYHQAAIMTRATTTRMTRAVFLSNPDVCAGDGLAGGVLLNFTVVVTGGVR